MRMNGFRAQGKGANFLIKAFEWFLWEAVLISYNPISCELCKFKIWNTTNGNLVHSVLSWATEVLSIETYVWSSLEEILEKGSWRANVSFHLSSYAYDTEQIRGRLWFKIMRHLCHFFILWRNITLYRLMARTTLPSIFSHSLSDKGSYWFLASSPL